ncbi:MAG: peroxiredoxin family protein [Cyclobacteriaceae bacterium]|nr:peroxiredoxin family protein [Cyclobacteriaceae bacterium]
MERLKSIFFHVSVVYWMLLSGFTIYFIYATGISIPALGMLAISFIPSGFMAWLYTTKKPRTSANQTLLTFSTFIGLGFFIVGSVNISAPLLIMYSLSLVFWLLFIFWYSHLPNPRSDILRPGKALPELNFKTYANEEFYCSSLLGKKVIYLFYRGNWCPVCMAQIREIAGQYKDLKERGAEMLLISPQPQSKSKELSEKVGMNFLFLTDEHNEMARKLKIEHADGVPVGNLAMGYESDTVLPTVVITDEHGKIIFVDQTDNFRIRPEPSTFISVLDANALN